MSNLRKVSFKLFDLLVIFMMIFGPPMSGFVTPALAAPVLVLDDAGADDEPGQKDLNFLTIDYAPSTPDIAVTWGWDDTMWSGNNTGDACTLFDTDGDGFANYSLCITVDQNGSYLATRLYACTADSRTDRCGGPTLIPTLASTGSASIQAVDPFGTAGRTSSDCSSTVKGACLTEDTVAALTVKLSDFGGATAKLINVCSYPSQEPNSDPSDCVITPNAGFLTIVKDAGTDTSTNFVFNASENSAGGDNTWTITGSGSVQLISYMATTTLDLTEVIPSGWQLDDAACFIQTTTPTATGTETSTGVDNLEIRSGLETICTFKDSLQMGTLIVEKNLVNDNLGPKACSDFSYTIDGGSAVAFESDCSNSQSVLAGSHTVVEVGVPIQGYTTTYSNCTNVNVPAGGTATCTITNDDIAVPKINVTKSSTTSSITAAGQVVPYTFVVTNTGNQTLTGITVSDPNCDSSPAYVSGDDNADSKLQVAEAWTYTCSHTVTQVEIDSNGGGDGDLDNTVTADSNESDPDTADYFILITQTAKLSIIKTGAWVDGDADGYADVGEVINYTFAVKNEGNVTLHNVTVADTVGGVTISGGPTTLDVGETDTTTFTGVYHITQADINGGHFFNTATADSNESGPASDDEDVTLPQNPAIDLLKTGTFDAGADGYANVGELISYTFVVTNIGNVTLTSITVTDPKVSNISCPATTLAVGAKMTCTATYAVTQADIDAGFVYNLATADSMESGPDTDDETVTLTQNAKLSIVKTGAWVDGDGDGYADVGEVINYTFAVKNEGNVTLTNVTVTDPKVTVVGGPTTLDVGETDTTTFTGSYTLTQADIDAGKVDNTATADSDESGPASDDETVTLPQNPALTLDKTGTFGAGANGYADPGELISYEFLVINTGNVTLTSITVTDLKVSPISCPFTTLAVGTSMTCTGTYAVTQADIDAGSVYNLATADSKESPPDDGDNNEPLPQNPVISLVKSGTFGAGADGYANVGELISYEFLVTNEGNVTLTGITVTDPKVSNISCPKTTLAVGESMTCTGSYAVTQADIDAGFVYNLATADSKESPPDDGDNNEPLPQNPALTLDKTGTFDAGADGFADPGELISYEFLVTNTGNVTLTGITVTDPKVSPIACPATTLAVGANMTCTGTYAVTQADIDAGFVYNLATADSNESGPDDGDNNEPLPQNPALTIDKTATPATYDEVGDVISYSYLVANSGNVTLYNISVVDDKATVSCPDTSAGLAPLGQITCTASYTIKQADLDSGSVTNTAYATDGTTDSEPDSETVDAIQSPALTLDKTTTTSTYDSVGDTIDYSYKLTNSGNVTLIAPFTVDDDKATVTCPPTPTSLSPGDSITCTASYTVTQDDIDDGFVKNTAKGHAFFGTTKVDSNEDSVTVNATQNPAITLTKSASPTLYRKAGDVITYTLVVKNTGNVTLHDVSIADPLVSNISCPKTTLAVGESMTCTGTYTIQAADLTVFSVTNTAKVTGKGPQDQPVEATATATVYRQTAAMLPTQTTCQQYATGPSAWPAMYDAFTYQVKSNKISSVAPGVIFYYNTIMAPSASFTLSVVETNSLNWKPMLIQDLGQAILYDANCNKASGGTVTAGGNPYTVTFTVTGATPGAIYYIGIKYSPQNLIGQQVKQPYPTSIYTWSTTGYNGSTANIPVKPKK